MRNAVWILLVLGLVTGCGGGDVSPAAQPAPSASAPSASSPAVTLPTPTSSVTVRPADPAWSTPAAVSAYRAAMKPVTTQLTKLSAMSPSARLGRTRTALRAYARASTTAVESLLRGKWDDHVRPSVNTLIAALLDQQAYFDALAGRNDVASIRAAADKTGQVLLVTRTCAAALEKRLGVGDGLLDLASTGSGAS